MKPVLNENDVIFARDTIVATMNKNSLSSSDNVTSKLSGALEILIVQAIIPFLVSLTSSVLAEVIKGKLISSMRRSEAESVIKDLYKRPLVPRSHMDDECFSEALKIVQSSRPYRKRHKSDL